MFPGVVVLFHEGRSSSVGFAAVLLHDLDGIGFEIPEKPGKDVLFGGVGGGDHVDFAEILPDADTVHFTELCRHSLRIVAGKGIEVIQLVFPEPQTLHALSGKLADGGFFGAHAHQIGVDRYFGRDQTCGIAVKKNTSLDLRIDLIGGVKDLLVEGKVTVGIVSLCLFAGIVPGGASGTFAVVAGAVVDRKLHRIGATVSVIFHQIVNKKFLYIGIAHTGRPVAALFGRGIVAFSTDERKILGMCFTVFFGVDDRAEGVPGDVAAAFPQTHAGELLVNEGVHGPGTGVEIRGLLFVYGFGHLPFGVIGDHKSEFTGENDVIAQIFAQEKVSGVTVAPGIPAHQETDILFPFEIDRIADDKTVPGFPLQALGIFAPGCFLACDDKKSFCGGFFKGNNFDLLLQGLGKTFGKEGCSVFKSDDFAQPGLMDSFKICYLKLIGSSGKKTCCAQHHCEVLFVIQHPETPFCLP